MSCPAIKMLVADDSRTVQKFFEGVVARSRVAIELVTAETGSECMRYLSEYSIDLAFIDVNMPEMSGMEAVGRARFNGNRTFVTLMSAKADAERYELARQIRAYEYLVKPFSMADIENLIKTYQQVAKRTKTLIVDDSRTIRHVIRRVLQRSIFRLEIEEAANGERALARFEAGDFDLVFLDWNMPGLNGLQTLERIRTLAPHAKTIMISAERNEQRVQEAMNLGASTFLFKPFFKRDVDKAVHAAFGLKMPALAEMATSTVNSPSMCSADETSDWSDPVDLDALPALHPAAHESAALAQHDMEPAIET